MLLLFLSSTGILLSVILLYFNARNYRSSVYLGLFFFTLSVYGFIEYALIYSRSVLFIGVMYINFGFLSYLTGPMIYWYFRSVLTDKAGLRKTDLLHFLPSLIFLGTALPYILSPWSQKVMSAQKIIESIGYIEFNRATPLYEVFSVNAIFLSRPIQILIYAIFAAWILIQHLSNKRDKPVLSHQKYMFKWLMVLLFFLFILTVSQMILLKEVFIFKKTVLLYTLNILQLLSGAGLVGLLVSPFFFPSVLYGLPRVPEKKVSEVSETPGEEKSGTSELKPALTFETSYLLLIRDKTDSCMKEFKPYLKQDCNLAYISGLTEIPVHHLAYYFREEKKQTFTDFRNECRIRHAKQLMEEGKSRELTLEAIGMLSGFSTRNTFFNAFKKFTGMSPGSYSSKFS